MSRQETFSIKKPSPNWKERTFNLDSEKTSGSAQKIQNPLQSKQQNRETEKGFSFQKIKSSPEKEQQALQQENQISVIMVSYQTGEVVFEAIQALLSIKTIHQILFVNNGNESATEHKLTEFAKKDNRFVFLHGHGNIGFSKGCNLGAEQAKGNLLLFLNPDAILGQESLEALQENSQGLASPWCVGGQLLDANLCEQRGARRGDFTLFSTITSLLGLHHLSKVYSGFSRFFKNIHKTHEPLPKEKIEVPVISGACMLMQKKDFESLGGFDEKYFLHVEDIDLCRRVHQAGGQVCFVPQAKILHYGATSKVPRIKIEWEKAKSFLYYFYKFSKGYSEKIFFFLISPLIILFFLGRGFCTFFLSFLSIFKARVYRILFSAVRRRKEKLYKPEFSPSLSRERIKEKNTETR